MSRAGVVVSVLAIGAFLTGCSEDEPLVLADGGGGVGEPCKSSDECGVGLVCSGQGTCARPGDPGTAIQNDGCAYNTDCLYNLVCSSNNRCVPPGGGKAGDPCKGNQDCGLAYLCSSGGTCAKPGDPGTRGPKQSCSKPQDCAFGLVCADGTCTPLSYWKGASCAASDNGPLRAYFEVPRKGKALSEFYRLPFPNDIRLVGGKIDLEGHPDPGTAVKEYGDVVGTFIKAIEDDVTGWGTNTATYFRVSKAFDLGTIKVGIVNIDKNSPDYAKGKGYNMWATTGRGKYICNNYIAVRPAVGKPYQPLTTYAVLLYDGIKDTGGNKAVQDADFKALLAETAPGDADLKAAWTAYQPLRDYMQDKGVLKTDLLAAAVFTTMNPRHRMSRFRDVIENQAETPVAGNLTLCDGKTKSPCDDGKDATRICAPSPSSSFHELQGTYKTPAFQAGTRPYKKPSAGGAIQYDSAGKPIIQSHDQACFALSIPKSATMPADGWPVVIYAHGTGGNYRSFVENGVAASLGHVKDAKGAVSQMAVIGIDGSMHGPRRGSTDSPDKLFFNLRNPRASRDNTYQGAADKFQLVRLIKSINLQASQSPTGEAIKFDLNRIYYYGHSQGTIEGVPFLVYEPEVKATVLSGAGGYLLESLLNKTKPVNVAGLIQLALADNGVDNNHPLLNLVQLFFEEVDAVNYGRLMFIKPLTGVGAKHTLLTYGVADSFTPPRTIDALGWSMEIRLARQSAERCGDGVCNGSESCKTCAADCSKCPAGSTCGDGNCEGKERCYNCQEDCKPCPPLYATDDPPVKDNIYTEGETYTCSMVRYSSDGSYDDHFVAAKHPHARTQTSMFLGTAARDGGPTVVKVK